MTRLAILWHMHQPFYEDLATREHILPWVRLHTIKDYWGMAALLREFPEIRVTFNLVPSLVMQIQTFAEDRANDRYLTLGLSDAASLSATDRAFLIANGFHAPVDRMIRPYPRYFELHTRRKQPSAWTTADVRDLQVWHKLVWMDPDWLTRDPRLRALVERGRNYTEGDKLILRDVELELLRATIPIYREVSATGRVELSTSPLYHPILPLLCDSDVHRRSHPSTSMPPQMFARPEDAMQQLRRARAMHLEVFGAAPQGVWPSEGSLSDEVIQLLRQEGFTWTATDQDILSKSMGRPLASDDLYRPYEIGADAGTIRCLFRDHDLSDRIGFLYQSWDAEVAAEDFLARLRDAARRFSAATKRGDDGEDATIAVILDGENAWEHYAGGGRPFLRALYRQLQAALDIETVTMSEAAGGSARRLPSIYPGSWINADFYIWAGHRDDHRAWGQLAEARRAFDEHSSEVSAERRAVAWEELLIAEGSDWFWWYGDDHSSDHDAEFDGLFRRHLRNVYQALDAEPPPGLFLTNVSTPVKTAEPNQQPASLTTAIGPSPFVALAGSVPIGGTAGSMHQAGGPMLNRLRLAADRSHLFLGLEGIELLTRLVAGNLGLELLVEEAVPVRLEIQAGPGHGARWTPSGSTTVLVSLPFTTIGRQAGDSIRAVLLVVDPDRRVLEQHPVGGVIGLTVPSRHLNAINWRI